MLSFGGYGGLTLALSGKKEGRWKPQGLWNEVPGSDLRRSLLSTAAIQDESQGHSNISFSL